jgi:type II secretory pathway component GspD/PulD (secretin)
VPLKFSVDSRTNSVIAVGSADALRVVEAILLRLDESNLRSRKNIVVRLNNAPAAQIATAVSQFFQQQRDLAQNDPNLVSNVEQLEREVIVIPDSVSNNLLVSTTPRYLSDIMTMIEKLDMRPKQVVIQALIVEVQLNNTDEFGIELGVQSPILFDRSLKQQPIVQTTTSTPVGQPQVTSQILLSEEGTPGFNFNNPGVPLGNNVLADAGIVGGQSLTNFSLGRVNSQLGYGGLVLSAGSNSVNALLRALAARTKIQILSRPQIRALDGILSEVFVGQTIPTVTSFQTNATTGVISPVLTQRDTGIGMQVMPRINLDGDIVIQLYAFRSQLSQQTVNVTTDSRGQPVGQRITDLSNVRTTVLVPSNSTIVIGGMISTRDETTNRKAPFLGDIPILGQMFRYDSRSTVRSEMLIFLTPRVVDGPCEEEDLKEIEMGRLHFIESEAEAAHGPLRGIPAPDDLFDNDQTPWIGPGSPNIPPSPSLNMPANPTPIQTPTSPTPVQQPPSNVPPAPPAQTPGSPAVPPAPPLPDPNLTRINALRAMATEQDDSGTATISTADYTVPVSNKRRTTKPARIFDSQR